jgi:hypothetical protein
MKIVRMKYSRSPWRLVDSRGTEIYWRRPFKHSDLGETVVDEPICGETKTECISNALHALELLMLRDQGTTLESA